MTQFGRQVGFQWIVVGVLLLVGFLVVRWATLSEAQAQAQVEEQRRAAEEARARAEDARQAAEKARQEAADKAAADAKAELAKLHDALGGRGKLVTVHLKDSKGDGVHGGVTLAGLVEVGGVRFLHVDFGKDHGTLIRLDNIAMIQQQ